MAVVTRRIFLQTAAASGVVLASESTGKNAWLRSASDQLRLALIGMGPRGLDALAMLVAIPAARVVALCDSSPDRLAEGASALQRVGKAHPRIATRIEHLLEDPGVDALVISGGFPNSIAKVPMLLAAKKPILFDAPQTSSFEEAMSNLRAVSGAESIVRSRLADFVDPDSGALWRDHASLRMIGAPRASTLTSGQLVVSGWSPGGRTHSSLPMLACIHVLVSCSVEDDAMADFAKEGGGGLRRVAQSQGYTRLQFGENSSFLQSVDVQRLAEPTAAPAVLRLIGEQGHLRCNGLAHAHSEGSARTILRFLGAIRSQPEAETYGGQRAFLAAGLWTVLMASNGTRRV